MRSWSAPEVPSLAVTAPQVRLHDTSTGDLVTSAPDGPARLYVCGITPYDATHMGHAATYLGFDLLQRAWRNAGHDVEFVQNVTGGVRVYLSDDPYKTLIDRHRKDDPKVYAPTFPTLAPQTTAQKSTPQCMMSGNQVASPAGGDCICPSGTWTPGQNPTQAGGGGGGSSAPYYCGGL